MSQQHDPRNGSGTPQAPWYGDSRAEQAPKTFPFGEQQAGSQGQAYGDPQAGPGAHDAQQGGTGAAHDPQPMTEDQPYTAQEQSWQQPQHEAQPQYGSQGQAYGSQGAPYGDQQHGQPQQQSWQQQQYGSQGQAYGQQPQQQYGSQGQPYGAPQAYGQQAPGQQHVSQGQPYGDQSAPQHGGSAGSYAPTSAQPQAPAAQQPQQQFQGFLDPHTGEIHPVPDLQHLQESDALLVVVSGPDAGAQILLDTDVVTVGRSPNADIFLDDVTVSRKHAEFVRTPSGFTLRDTGSLNGTYVGRQLIDSVELQNGADVQIGKFRMIFQQRPRNA
ncbi:FHA domain-containing protein [Brevibacterium ihuae]|uniref:FHA domain-containing protein n=1 Tax=Brevibacterium ihuae TaxID=1631743 RepID=UPI003CCB989F